MFEEWALPTINLALCIRCEQCVSQCPTQAVEMQPQGPVIVRPHDCTYCTICETACPVGAIACFFEITWDTRAHGC